MTTLLRGVRTDTERSVLLGLPKSAICVQRFDDSLHFAIRITYRISLRSSSLREPRYPLLRVVFCLYNQYPSANLPSSRQNTPLLRRSHSHDPHVFRMAPRPINANDPSAGSPTETL